jgi:hypothetical protein
VGSTHKNYSIRSYATVTGWVLLLILPPRLVDAASSANTTANATATVIASIGIVKVSDLAFGTAAPGDATATVLPGTIENASNASFTVSGQASTAYTITLPSSVTMTTGVGGANRTILVNAFASFPTAGAGTGLIGGGGTQLLLVGATRAAIGASQVAGAYSAAFTVTVNY